MAAPSPVDPKQIAASLLDRGAALWPVLGRLSWANPDIVRAHVMPLDVDIQGVLGAAGAPVDADDKVVSKHYFIVRSVHGRVERDSTDPTEAESSEFVIVQLRDQEREFNVFRESIRMSALAGTRDRAPQPMIFDDLPLVYLPAAQIVATFTPQLGFPAGASAITGLTTRSVGLELRGALVDEELVDALIAMNDHKLRAMGLIGRKGRINVTEE